MLECFSRCGTGIGTRRSMAREAFLSLGGSSGKQGQRQVKSFSKIQIPGHVQKVVVQIVSTRKILLALRKTSSSLPSSSPSLFSSSPFPPSLLPPLVCSDKNHT